MIEETGKVLFMLITDAESMAKFANFVKKAHGDVSVVYEALAEIAEEPRSTGDAQSSDVCIEKRIEKILEISPSSQKKATDDQEEAAA